MDNINGYFPAAFVVVFLVAFCNAMKSDGPRIGVYASYSLPCRNREADDYINGNTAWGETDQCDPEGGRSTQ